MALDRIRCSLFFLMTAQIGFECAHVHFLFLCIICFKVVQQNQETKGNNSARFRSHVDQVRSSQVKSSQGKQTLFSHVEKVHDCGLFKRLQVHTVHMGRNKTTM